MTIHNALSDSLSRSTTPHSLTNHKWLSKGHMISGPDEHEYMVMGSVKDG